VFDVDRYLEILGWAGPADATLATLTELHRRHLQTIPYDNSFFAELDLANIAAIDVDAAFTEVVLGRRGGICTQINRLFGELLTRLGFDVTLLAASTLFPGNVFGPPVEHMIVLVRLGDDWLVDVGFGGVSFVEPLRICADVQTQNGVEFQLVPEDGHQVLRYRSRGGHWRTSYRFQLRPRTVDDWSGALDAMFGPDAAAEVEPIIRRRRLVGTDQFTQTGKLCSTVRDGQEKTVHLLIDPAAHNDVVTAITSVRQQQ
jgi:amide synthase